MGSMRMLCPRTTFCTSSMLCSSASSVSAQVSEVMEKPQYFWSRETRSPRISSAVRMASCMSAGSISSVM